jgi:hypothetical protein
MPEKKSKIAGLKAERAKLETTDALRLDLELARCICEHCGQKPKVYCTRGETRYVKCGCGRKGQVTVERRVIRWQKMLTEEEFDAIMAGSVPDEGTDEAADTAAEE